MHERRAGPGQYIQIVPNEVATDADCDGWCDPCSETRLRILDASNSGRDYRSARSRSASHCGYVAETYRSKQNIPREALPNTYDSARPFGSVLYFLVTREANIRVHRIRSDQMYHHYLGNPWEVLLLYPDGSGRIATVGPDYDGDAPTTFYTRRNLPCRSPEA